MVRIGAGASTDGDAWAAASAAAGEARSALGSAAGPTLAVVVASRHHAAAVEAVSDAVRATGAPDAMIGCMAETVVAGPREVEGEPAVSVWMASLPEPAETFSMEFVRTSEGGVFGGYRFADEPAPHLLIADPFTFPTDHLLRVVNDQHPGTVLVGGMASGGMAPGQTRLFLDDRVLAEGAVGARLPGVRLRTLVSQGCRPIGEVYAVTRAEGNVIHELGGRPPLERIRQIVGALSPADQELAGRGLHVGRVIDEYKAEPDRGDFLVRGVVGADPSTGAIAVGDHIGVGETIRFHVRDAATADEDLRTMLSTVDAAAGALLFTCNGRGSRLFDVPDHDASLVSARLAGAPLAGFNCAGEIGPIGGRNFLHGFTASLALFEDEG